VRDATVNRLDARTTVVNLTDVTAGTLTENGVNPMHNGSRAAWVLFAAALLLSGGCRKTAETAADTKASPAAAPGPPQRTHRMFMNGISPLIVSVSPETVNIYKGRALDQRFTVTYEIGGAEKVTKAAISVRSEDGGQLQRLDVAVEPRAQVDFLLSASSYDLGPTVRFRVRCAAGDTDWYTMGVEPVGVSSEISTPQIGNVTPGNISAWNSRPPGSGVPVTIWGAHFTQGCTPEATVDWTSIELKNVLILNSQISTLLLYSDLQGRPVSARHLSVNLEVTSTTGMVNEDTFQLNFKD
jgi:hypothetical protein